MRATSPQPPTLRSDRGPTTNKFPLRAPRVAHPSIMLLFISAKMGILFACVEIGLSVTGLYKEKERVYRSMSRAITALGMSISFMLLLGAFEQALR